MTRRWLWILKAALVAGISAGTAFSQMGIPPWVKPEAAAEYEQFLEQRATRPAPPDLGPALSSQELYSIQEELGQIVPDIGRVSGSTQGLSVQLFYRNRSDEVPRVEAVSKHLVASYPELQSLLIVTGQLLPSGHPQWTSELLLTRPTVEDMHWERFRNRPGEELYEFLHGRG